MSARQRKVCKRLEQCRGRLHRMAYAWTHQDDVADDVVQETMIKALMNADRVNELKSVDSWLFRILFNCFIDVCRKHRPHSDVDDELLFEPDTPESVHSRKDMLASVRAAISQLPLKQRQVVTLVDIENFTYAEVAEITDVPIGTVMSRLNRARQALKQILADFYKESKAGLRIVK